MSFKHLAKLFKPNSVAVIGAPSEEEVAAGADRTAGAILLRNLQSGTFLGPIMPVREDTAKVAGLESYRAVETLPLTPDLAVFCTDPAEAPPYLHELGRRGAKAAVMLSRGGFRADPEERAEQKALLAEACRPYGLRLLGPNCLGFLNPHAGLNVSLAHRDIGPGRVAFVSQSDALFTSVLDWAASKGIGFSYCISLGDRLDINFATALDFLNEDFQTKAVLLYMETIVNSRAFMSAARATARNKPVLVVKAGRTREGAQAAATHSGAFLGADDVYDAAFRRSGILRVMEIDTLFDTVETVARSKPVRGDRLAILTNGGSQGFMASDALVAGGGSLAEYSAETRIHLDEAYGGQFTTLNPLVIRADADGAMYADILRALLKDSGVDAVLAMHVPTAMADSLAVAEAVIEAGKRAKRVVLTSWLGVEDAEPARKRFAEAGMATFFTPDKAIRGFLNMVHYHRAQELLQEAPASLPTQFSPDLDTAREVVAAALEEGRMVLSELEARQLLDAYGIPLAPSAFVPRVEGAAGPAAVVAAAEKLGFPVALKVAAPSITRKTLAGGVALNLHSAEAVREAAAGILLRVEKSHPGARIEGFTVQRMVPLAGAHELFVEAATDPVFGPVIRFGQGGSLAQVMADRQAALPPLNMSLAKDLIMRSQVARQLSGYADHPAADLDALRLLLCKLSQMVVDLPELFELEINPLFATADGVLALDAQARVARPEGEVAAPGSGHPHLAIRPYPSELEECARLKDGRPLELRPILPEDEPAHWEFVDAMSPEDRRFRFFGNVGELPRSEMIRFTQIDYDREMAFVAKGPLAWPCETSRMECPPDPDDPNVKTLGVVRAMTKPDNSLAEFAVAIRSDMKRQGLGRLLMDKIVRYCKSRGTERIVGQALADNKGMVTLAEHIGFDVRPNLDEDIMEFDFVLNPPTEQEPGPEPGGTPDTGGATGGGGSA